MKLLRGSVDPIALNYLCTKESSYPSTGILYADVEGMCLVNGGAIGLGNMREGKMEIQTFTPIELFGSLNDVEEKNAPMELHIAGNSELLRTGRRVSVVGSRKVTAVGAKRTAVFVKELIAKDIIVVSGLAEGVDTIAHKRLSKKVATPLQFQEHHSISSSPFQTRIFNSAS